MTTQEQKLNDIIAINNIFQKLLQIINQDNQANLKSLHDELLKISSPTNTMALISKSLFLEKKNESNENLLNPNESFQLLTNLVSSNPQKYLIPSSQCIYKQTQELASNNFLLNNEYNIIVTDELLTIFIDQLSYYHNVEVTENVSKSIILLCQCLPSLCLKAIAALVPKWKDTSLKNYTIHSTISMRYASTIINISIQSDENMTYLSQNHKEDFLNVLLHKISDDSDPLLQMSYLDLIEIMVESNPMHYSRAHWLLTSTVLQSLLNMVDDPILSGVAIRLLSSICTLLGHYDSIFSNNTNTTSILESFRNALLHFNQRGETNRIAFIDAVSTFASSSSEALVLVLQEGNDTSIRHGWLSLSHAYPKLKSIVLFSVAKVLDPISPDGSNTNSVIPSNKHAMLLLDALSQVNSSTPTSTLLFTQVKSTIVEIRLGAYRLIKAMVKHSIFTAQLVLSHSDAYEFLTNGDSFNSIETTKEGKEAKFEIVVELMNHDNVVNTLLNDDVRGKLEKVVKLGPFHVSSAPFEMATE